LLWWERSNGFHAIALTLTLLYVVNLLFGDAIDAIENLLIYSTKPAILETNENNENESLRPGEITIAVGLSIKYPLMKYPFLQRMP